MKLTTVAVVLSSPGSRWTLRVHVYVCGVRVCVCACVHVCAYCVNECILKWLYICMI